jgi:hypothetical protein
MKRRIFGFVFVLVCWLCFPKSAGATLDSGCFAAHYSSYTSINIGSDDNSVIQTVQVSGYTEAKNPAVWMGPQLGWQYPCTNMTNQMQSSTHTSNIRNVVGSTGGNYSEGPTPALSYDNYVVSITASLAPGTVYNIETNAGVTCPLAGIVFFVSFAGNTRFVQAYYYGSAGSHTYHRCNPVGDACDTVYLVNSPVADGGWPLFGLFNAVYINTGVVNLCIVGRHGTRADMCISPDPHP